jgi:hypothetical protein
VGFQQNKKLNKKNSKAFHRLAIYLKTAPAADLWIG